MHNVNIWSGMVGKSEYLFRNDWKMRKKCENLSKRGLENIVEKREKCW